MVGNRIQHKIASITASDAQRVDSEALIGYFYYRERQFFSIEDKIVRDLEESTRCVCQVLNYSPGDVWKMNCYEFFRDLMRANTITEQRKAELRKWQSKSNISGQ